jgi:hypothetical protein
LGLDERYLKKQKQKWMTWPGITSRAYCSGSLILGGGKSGGGEGSGGGWGGGEIVSGITLRRGHLLCPPLHRIS